MIWLALAALGIPLWTLGLALVVMALRVRTLGRRSGDLVVRINRAGSRRWIRGHALWIHDVLVVSRTMALWSTILIPVVAAAPVELTGLDARRRHGLRRLRDPVVATLLDDGGSVTHLASADAPPNRLLGPFGGSPHAIARGRRTPPGVDAPGEAT